MSGISDSFQRPISYLRISVTDRCNLRCVYCMPPEGIALTPHSEILRYEEILSVVRVSAEMGINRVRLSGGEPLAQPEFLLALLRACKAEGIHTAVDTCGLAATRQVLAVAPFTDLFLYDLKLMDEARHRQFTGVSNTLILENLKVLSGVHRQIWIRVPVIPGVNDSAADLEAAARFAEATGRLQRRTLPTISRPAPSPAALPAASPAASGCRPSPSGRCAWPAP